MNARPRLTIRSRPAIAELAGIQKSQRLCDDIIHYFFLLNSLAFTGLYAWDSHWTMMLQNRFASLYSGSP